MAVEDEGDGGGGWQSPSLQRRLSLCGMHPTAQPAPPPLAFRLPVKEGRCCESLGSPFFCWTRCPLCNIPTVTRTLVSDHQPGLQPRQLPPIAPAASLLCRSGWSGLPCRAAFFPEADRTAAVGEGGPGNPRADAAASEVLPVLGAPGCVCCPSSCSDVLVITRLVANWLMLS